MATSLPAKSALRHHAVLYLFVLPALAFVLLFAYAPAGSALYHSFFQWRGGDVKRYVGLANFQKVMGDSVFWSSFGTVGILVASNIIKLIPSVFLAVMIHRLRSDGWRYWYRVLVVVPMIVPGLVTLFVWKFFFDPNIGPLNQMLDISGGTWLLRQIDGLLHLHVFQPGQPIGWLSQSELVVPALILWGFPWIGSVGVLIYLAGLEGIGQEVYEAADLDGVSSFQRFWCIEFPLIMTQIRLTLVLLIVGTLQSFGLQLLLLNESGGPGGKGMVPGLWMYNRAFVAGEFGYACALGLILFGVILALTWINNKLVRVDK